MLANLESLNAELIRMGIEQSARIGQLNRSAIAQLQSLADAARRLPRGTPEEQASSSDKPVRS